VPKDVVTLIEGLAILALSARRIGVPRSAGAGA
jgi:hypothetical protein